MAISFSYSNSFVHFRYLSQKTTANPVLGHGMIKLLKPLHITRTGVRALQNASRSEIGFNGTEGKYGNCRSRIISVGTTKYDCEDRILNLLNSPDKESHKLAGHLSSGTNPDIQPTMATSFSYSNSIVHFRYLSQKTTANSVLGHGMIKLLKPLHITRTGVRALQNASRSEIGFNGTEGKYRICKSRIISVGRTKYDCEDGIKNLLKLPLPHNDTELHKLAKYVSNQLAHIGTHDEEDGGLVYLYKEILTKAHISRMWEIAYYNHTDSARAMLPDVSYSPVIWGGKSGKINEGVSEGPPRRGILGLPKRQKRFPLKGEWKMKIDSVYNAYEYNVVFKGKSGSVFVEENPNGVPEDAKRVELAFAFGAKGPWHDQFVMYIRSAGPNVLVGQAWKASGKRKEFWAELVLVKIK